MSQLKLNSLLILGFLLYFGRTSGQFLPRFTQYREYSSLINPATLPSEFLANNGYYTLAIGLSHRSEGLIKPGQAPQTQVVRVNWTPNAGRRFRLLLGSYVLSDRFGPTGFTEAFLRLGAFTYGSTQFGVLSAGFHVGLTQFQIKIDDNSLLAPGDPLENQIFQQIYPNVGMGLFYSKRIQKRHDAYIGFSVARVFDLDRSPEAKTPPPASYAFRTIVQPHYYALAGIAWYVSDYAFWEPSLWVKILPKQITHVDFNLRYQFRRAWWAGLGMSTQKTVHSEFGFHFQDMIKIDGRLAKSRKPFLRLGFGYDFSFSSLPNNLDQALEINLAMIFPGQSRLP